MLTIAEPKWSPGKFIAFARQGMGLTQPDQPVTKRMPEDRLRQGELRGHDIRF